MRQPYRVRVWADLHVNSYFGIWPDSFVAQGVPFAQTPDSKWIWENARELVRQLPKADLNVVNGDLTHGLNRKSAGTGVYTQSQDIMNQAAEAVVALLVGNSPWYMVQGTPYHEPEVAYVSKRLHAETWLSGEQYGQVLDLKVRGKGLSIAHHPDGGGAIYKGTTMDRTALWSIISAYLGKVYDAPIIVRSHVHFYALWQANGRTVVQTPCMTFPDPYAKKQAYFRYTSDIGCVDILIQHDERYPTVQSWIIEQPVPSPIEVIEDEVGIPGGAEYDIRTAAGRAEAADAFIREELGRRGPEVGGGSAVAD